MLSADPGPEPGPLPDLDMFIAVGRDVAAQPDTAVAFQVVVDAAVRVLVGTRWASGTEGLDDGFATVASSGPVAVGADALQYRLGTGPCLDAVVHESVFESADLALDPRWSAFGPQASRDHGTRSVLSIRLTLDDERHRNASLNLYGDHIAAFDAGSRRSAVFLAALVSISLAAVTGREQGDQMSTALDSNREIGVAMGVLMATLKVTREQAFDLLRTVSPNTNRRVRDIATEVADTGLLNLTVHGDD